MPAATDNEAKEDGILCGLCCQNLREDTLCILTAVVDDTNLDGALLVLGHFRVTVPRKIGEVAHVLVVAVFRLFFFSEPEQSISNQNQARKSGSREGRAAVQAPTGGDLHGVARPPHRGI